MQIDGTVITEFLSIQSVLQNRAKHIAELLFARQFGYVPERFRISISGFGVVVSDNDVLTRFVDFSLQNLTDDGYDVKVEEMNRLLFPAVE